MIEEATAHLPNLEIDFFDGLLVDFATKPPSIVASGTYTDELVKTAQGWQFKKRRTKADVAPTAPASP